MANNMGNVSTIDALSELLRAEGFQVEAYSSKKNKWFRMLDMLYQTFRLRRKMDLVLIDTYSTLNFYYAVWVAKLCRIFKLKYVPILHGGDLPRRLERNPGMSKTFFLNARINVSPSKFLMKKFKRFGIKNINFIPNTIEIVNYPFKSRKEIKAKLLWVRSFAKIYNPMLALKVLELFIEQGVSAELCMVGPDKDGSLANCKEYATKKSLPVTFTGKLSKKEWITLSKEYDIFINTTNFDNMPVSVIEAMALGLPVLSTNVGGMPYLIDHGKSGVLLPPDDETAFVHAICDLISHPDKASYLAKNARKHVEQFDWEIVKHKWFEVL
jgi:glycosyltransferase involved in cell wall biosynthesis